MVGTFLPGNHGQNRLIAMQSPREILSDIWTSAGGAPDALDAVTLAGEEPLPFHYHNKGSLATIGRSCAVAQLGKWKLSGIELPEPMKVELAQQLVKQRATEKE